MNIGSTVAEALEALETLQGSRNSYALTSDGYRPSHYYLDRLPVISEIERATLNTACPACGAKGWLCYAGTGLPASSPHPERILAAYQSTGL